MIFITDELGKFEKNIIELAENVGFKECKTIEAIDLFCGISERNDVLKEKDRYYAFIDIRYIEKQREPLQEQALNIDRLISIRVRNSDIGRWTLLWDSRESQRMHLLY